MSLRVTLELSDNDLGRFATLARDVQTAAGETGEEEVLGAARQLAAAHQPGARTDFISDRLDKLELLIRMVQDPGFALPADERKRVIAALAYCANPRDLIPDHIPGLGFLDDAIVLELICRDLKHELSAYRDFCHYRVAEASRRNIDPAQLDRADFLEYRRKQLISRMRRRRRRDSGDGGAARLPFSLL